MEATESNRDRVRRLLLEPLGFRFPKGVSEADGRATLDRIADELAYMADDKLEALARMLAPHGQGSAKCFWPDAATFRAFAHICQPLPLDQDPKLRSWFASVEGQRMVQDGTLVETWVYFERHRVPPYTPQARQLVLAKAEEAKRRLQIVAERERLGYGIDPAEAEWARRRVAMQAKLEALVRRVQAGKGVAA